MARPNLSTLERPKLIAWLRDNGKTQDWLADSCNVRQTSVSNWLRGGGMTLDNALAVVRATGLSVEDVSEIGPRVPTAAPSSPALPDASDSGSALDADDPSSAA